MYVHTQLWLASLVDDFHLDSLLLYDTLSYSYGSPASSSHTHGNTHPHEYIMLSHSCILTLGSVISHFKVCLEHKENNQPHIWVERKILLSYKNVAATDTTSQPIDQEIISKASIAYLRGAAIMISALFTEKCSFWFPSSIKSSTWRTRCTFKAWKVASILCASVSFSKLPSHSTCSSPWYVHDLYHIHQLNNLWPN